MPKIHKILSAKEYSDGQLAEIVLISGTSMRRCFMSGLPDDDQKAREKIAKMTDKLWRIHEKDKYSEKQSKIVTEETKDSEIDDWDGTEKNLKKILKKLSKESRKR